MTASDAMAAYLAATDTLLARIRAEQLNNIEAAAATCAEAITSGGVVHVLGSGHSRMVVEELWPRYGSFPGFHPIAELATTYWHSVVGTNGIRQAMFLENTPGLAAQIVRNFAISGPDAALAVSSSGTGVVTVEFAEQMKAAGRPVIAITSLDHARQAEPKAPSGHKLYEIADIIVDTCTPPGDAAVTIPGVAYRVGPTTSLAGALIANLIKVRVAELMAAAGQPPKVLPHALLVGPEEAARAFDAALDEHSRRTSRLHRC